MAKLTSFMVIAVRANCPLIAGFLQWAGAGAFFSASRKTTPLHAALEKGNLGLTETLMRDLGASLYIPDAQNRSPKDMSNMTFALLDKLETVSSQICTSYFFNFSQTRFKKKYIVLCEGRELSLEGRL